MSQRIPTRWPNARNMLRPTMLRCVVALRCCDRLAGDLYPFLVEHLSYQFHRDFRRKKKYYQPQRLLKKFFQYKLISEQLQIYIRLKGRWNDLFRVAFPSL